jgi:hypothetical protein
MKLWNEALRANGLSAVCPLGDEHELRVSGDGDHLACRKCHRTYRIQDHQIIPTWKDPQDLDREATWKDEL